MEKEKVKEKKKEDEKGTVGGRGGEWEDEDEKRA